MTPTGWIEVGEHLPPLVGWRARRLVSGELEVEAPGGKKEVLSHRGAWAHLLPAHRTSPVPELVEHVVSIEGERLAALASAYEATRKAAKRKAAEAYAALEEAWTKKHAPEKKKDEVEQA